MTSGYLVNRRIDAPIVFKGLQAQYIWWLGIGLAALLLLFALMYIGGIPATVCVVTVMILTTALFCLVSAMSKQFGEHGLMKWMASRSIPRKIKGCIIE